MIRQLYGYYIEAHEKRNPIGTIKITIYTYDLLTELLCNLYQRYVYVRVGINFVFKYV